MDSRGLKVGLKLECTSPNSTPSSTSIEPREPARAAGTQVNRTDWLRALHAGFVALALLAFVPACSSSSASAEPTSKGPVEVRYRALAKNVTFGIVNASHTDRTDLYSTKQPLDKATTKVSPDEVVDAMVEYFQQQGYFDIALTGTAPEIPPPGATQILSLTLPDGAYYAVLRSGVTLDFAAKFQACAKALQDVYNNTLQLQAVDEAPDWSGSSSRSGSKRSGG